MTSQPRSRGRLQPGQAQQGGSLLSVQGSEDGQHREGPFPRWLLCVAAGGVLRSPSCAPLPVEACVASSQPVAGLRIRDPRGRKRNCRPLSPGLAHCTAQLPVTSVSHGVPRPSSSTLHNVRACFMASSLARSLGFSPWLAGPAALGLSGELVVVEGGRKTTAHLRGRKRAGGEGAAGDAPPRAAPARSPSAD